MKKGGARRGARRGDMLYIQGSRDRRRGGGKKGGGRYKRVGAEGGGQEGGDKSEQGHNEDGI